MFRLNRIRVKLSGSLKRQQCGILHNSPLQSLKARGENLSDRTVHHSSFLLLQHSPWTAQLHIMCCSYYTITAICPKRPWKRAEAKLTKMRFASKSDLPTQTRSLHMQWALGSQCSLSDVFYSYMSAQVTILAKKLCSCNPDSEDCCSLFCIMTDNSCMWQTKLSNC